MYNWIGPLLFAHGIAGKKVQFVEVDPKKQLLQRLKADLAASADAYAQLEDAPVGSAPPQPQVLFFDLQPWVLSHVGPWC